MPVSITLKSLSYSTPDDTVLFDRLDLVFGPRRTGLIGRNGTGKSTLLKLITGALSSSEGEIVVNGSTGMLHQAVQVDHDRTVADLFGITADLARLDRVENGTASLDDAADADWTLSSRFEATLAEIGLPALPSDRPLATLSGGQRTLVALGALIFSAPDILLLDEPTNNLDAKARATVAKVLANWRGGAIVVSHDRALLRQMDSIVELTTLGATTYGGNWDHYRERKAIELTAAEHDLAVAERNVVAIDRKIQAGKERKARKDSAGNRKRARGDLPKILLDARKNTAEKTSGDAAHLARRQRAEAASDAAQARAQIEILKPLTVQIGSTGLRAGRIVLRCDHLTGGPLPDSPIIRDFSLTIVGPERVAITGPNGSGKTTLLRLLTGALPPVSGSVRRFGSYAMLDQTVNLLDPTLSIRDNFRHLNPDDDENACRTALARFMFRADAALQRVGDLSGGEMLRAGLAAVIGGSRPREVLILDEPTNHLDIAAIEAIEGGLRAYDGALLVISHDRTFLEGIGIEREITL